MEGRFELVLTQVLGMNNSSSSEVEIIRDKQTGVMYLARLVDRGVGLTVLVDRDGKPLTSFKVEI